MTYLNVGCGSHYSTKNEWVNIDFAPIGKEVIGHNLLKGIPFQDNSFDLVYHSHVLEHFSKQDGVAFIRECFRVLKPEGVIRVAIPDLEQITRKYLQFLEAGLEKPDDLMTRANYEWMITEMYDQTVRNKSGGEMLTYLSQDKIINSDFVFERIGEEGKDIRNLILSSKKNQKQIAGNSAHQTHKTIKSKIAGKVKSYLLERWGFNAKANEIGKFRLGGEIHQWMYDQYSLTQLLKYAGGSKIQIRDAFTSYISDWAGYELDGKNNTVRKPDSLFMEAIK